MARTLLTVMAAAALCLACADPTVAAPSEALPTAGLQPFNLNSITGTWWTYIREGKDDGPFEILEMEIRRKTPEEIAGYKQSWFPRNNSQTETNGDLDLINWQNVAFYGHFKVRRFNSTYTFLFETLTDPLHLRTINENGRIEILRVKFTNGRLIFREVSGLGDEYNFYRTLPDLAIYGRCESFDSFDPSEVMDASSLVGTWTTNRRLRGFFYTLRVTRKTADEISEYRDELSNTTIERADIDWRKVRLQAELISTVNYFRGVGLIEELNTPGSIRVIPLKDTWDSVGTREVDYWFTNQDLFMKRDNAFLAVRNCGNPWQKAYFSRISQ